jgi:uncharacterized protein
MTPDRRFSICLRMVAALCQTREDNSDEHCEMGVLPGRGHPAMILIALLLGLGVGVLMGLLGIGGGVVLVPAMVYLLRVDEHLAQGTSLMILLPPVGLGALLEYWKQGNVDLRAGILCALGMLAGGYWGGTIAVPLDSRHLKGLFGCFMILAEALLWRKPEPSAASASAPGGESAHA